jgi:hypothetical protein
MDNHEIMLKNKSFQGKIESAVWRKQATLRDILDAMDQLREAQNIDPKQKSALAQRIIDYGQHLSEQIFLGKRQVPETDDNETIKEFNLRMQDSAYSKYHWKKYFGEPPHGDGYYDENGKYINVLHPTSKGNEENAPQDVAIRGGAANPRWHPIPLRPTNDTPIPIDPKRRTDDGVTPIPVVPVPTDANTGEQGGGGTPPVKDNKTSDKKRRRWPLMLVPIIAAGILAKECQSNTGVIKDVEPEKTEQTVNNIVINEAENNYLIYTAEKGKAMLTKQGIEDSGAVYDNFVNNIDKMPQELKDLVSKYNMGTAKDAQVGVDISNNPQVTATTLILMAESYPNIAKIIHAQIQNPGAEISPVQLQLLNTRCKMAEQAHKTHNGNQDVNHISAIDYGLYGANRDTAASVKFATQEQAKDYTHLVKNVFDYGQSQSY